MEEEPFPATSQSFVLFLAGYRLRLDWYIPRNGAISDLPMVLEWIRVDFFGDNVEPIHGINLGSSFQGEAAVSSPFSLTTQYRKASLSWIRRCWSIIHIQDAF